MHIAQMQRVGMRRSLIDCPDEWLFVKSDRLSVRPHESISQLRHGNELQQQSREVVPYLVKFVFHHPPLAFGEGEDCVTRSPVSTVWEILQLCRARLRELQLAGFPQFNDCPIVYESETEPWRHIGSRAFTRQAGSPMLDSALPFLFRNLGTLCRHQCRLTLAVDEFRQRFWQVCPRSDSFASTQAR